MVERLGQAVLELRTDDARYTKGVARAEVGARKLDRGLTKTKRSARSLGARLSALGGRLSRLGRSLFSMRNAAVLAAGVTGLAFLTKKALDSADAIAKSADVIGISTDALQKYRFAAGQAGVDSDKFTEALKKLGKVIGEARVGTGTLVEILKKMDPALLQSLTRANSVEEAFLLMLDAISKTENQMDKLALSSAAFGRGAGLAIVNIAKDGGEAFREWARRLEEAGGIIPEQLTRQAESAKDELAFLSEIIRVQLTIALLQAAPEISRLAKEFSDAIPGIVAFVTNVITGFEGFVQPIKFAIEVVDALVLALGFLIASWVEGIRVLGEFLALLGSGIGTAVRATGRFLSPLVRPMGFQRGGSFSVGGGGGVDSQLVQFMATPGERVTVTPEGGARDGTRFNIDARGADLGVERRIERAMQRAVRLASAQAGSNLASALRASGA